MTQKRKAAPVAETPPEAIDKPKLPHEIALQMKEAGLSDDLIQAALTAQFGGGDGQGPAVRTPGAPGELGADPGMIAAYHERMKNYVPPKTDFKFCALRGDDAELQALIETTLDDCKASGDDTAEAMARRLMESLNDYGGVTLPHWAAQWCVQWQYWQQTIRRMPPGKEFTEAMTLSDIVRFHWHNHPQERAQLRFAENPNVKTGPASAFVGDGASAGTWKV